MTSAAQKKAVRTHRKRLRESGLGRFEVQGRLADKGLLRQIAKALAANGAEATRVRSAVMGVIARKENDKGGVWRSLRNSPLVGQDLQIERVRSRPRTIDL